MIRFWSSGPHFGGERVLTSRAHSKGYSTGGQGNGGVPETSTVFFEGGVLVTLSDVNYQRSHPESGSGIVPPAVIVVGMPLDTELHKSAHKGEPAYIIVSEREGLPCVVAARRSSVYPVALGKHGGRVLYDCMCIISTCTWYASRVYDNN